MKLLLVFAGIRYQLEVSGFKPIVDNRALYLCFAHGITKSILGMGIAMTINMRTIHIVSFVTDLYRQVAAGAF